MRSVETCVSFVVFHAGVLSHDRCPVGGILSHLETEKRSCEIENVTRDSVDKKRRVAAFDFERASPLNLSDPAAL